MRKFIVECTFMNAPCGGKPEPIHMAHEIEAEHRADALMAVLAEVAGHSITRIRAVPAKPTTTENGTEIPEDRTCGTCGWLHENSPQFTSGLYDPSKGQPWCWAVPSHVHRNAKLPACALWQAKEE